METKTKAVILSYAVFLLFLYFNLWCFILPLFEDTAVLSEIFPHKQYAVIIPILFFSISAMMAYTGYSVLRTNGHQFKLQYLERRDSYNTNGTL
ncbi:hypothetical protein ACHWQZ_G013719 [Mnemiopsis leidyi]